MAGHKQANPDVAAALSFGAWVRQLRLEKSLTQREVAAAAQMDSSHYGKVEAGKRFLTDAQLSAASELLGLPEGEMRRRMIAAQWVNICDGDASVMADVVGLVQEAAAPIVVSKPVNKPEKRLRIKR